MAIKVFTDYVVSDNPNAFPDGGEQGGYLYEKVVEGAVIIKSSVTFSSYTTTVSLSNPFGSADKVKAVLIYGNMSYSWLQCAYKDFQNDVGFYVGQTYYDDLTAVVSNDNIILKTPSKSLYPTTYNVEVIG